MRKGRSSRRSRISRPLMGVSVKGDSLSPDSGPLSGPASSSDGPRVVIGLGDSEPPPSLTESELPPLVEMKGPQTMPSFTKTMIESYVPTFSEPDRAPDPVVEVKAAVVEDAPLPKKDLAQTLVQGSASDDVAKPIEGALLPHAKDRLEELRQRKENRERLKEKRSAAEAAVRADAPSTDPDEVSVPPAGDLEVEDHTFFERGEQEAMAESQRIVQANAAVFELEVDALIPEKARRKSEPHIVRRRAKLAAYVKIAVAGAAIVCLAAVGRNAIHVPAKVHTPVQATQAEIKAPEPPPTAAAEPTPPPTDVKATEPAAAPAPSATEEAKPAEVLADVPVEVTGDAKEELKKSRTALERRKIAEAIEAGEKSVTLDPTSGEAWLVLGAAYQEKGDLVNAHRCYASCVKEGKSGPRLECQKMLR